MEEQKTYAEEVNYWETSRSSADSWLEKAKKEIRAVGGQIVGSGSFTDELAGRAGFMLAFNLGGESFTLKWPVLQSKKGKMRSAQIQAATALYHEVKASCVKVKFLGARTAFLWGLMLPDGRTAAEASSVELIEALPGIMTSNGNVALITDGEIVEEDE